MTRCSRWLHFDGVPAYAGVEVFSDLRERYRDLEELNEEELDASRNRYEAMAAAARKGLLDGLRDTGTPEA